MTDSEKLDLLINEIQELKHNVSTLEQKQFQTQITLENTVNKCIQALGEGFQLNAERLDKFDIEAIKNQSELSFMIAKATNEKVDKLIEKLNQSA